MQPSYSELEQRWEVADHGPKGVGRIELLVLRGPAIKGRDKVRDPNHLIPDSIEFHVDDGIEGDRWKRGKEIGAQVSLFSAAVAKLVAGERERWHLMGDNLVVDMDLSAEALPVGTLLSLGTGLIEISDEPHTACERFKARLGASAHEWVADERHAERHLRGRYARIIRGGRVSVGDMLQQTTS